MQTANKDHGVLHYVDDVCSLYMVSVNRNDHDDNLSQIKSNFLWYDAATNNAQIMCDYAPSRNQETSQTEKNLAILQNVINTHVKKADNPTCFNDKQCLHELRTAFSGLNGCFRALGYCNESKGLFLANSVFNTDTLFYGELRGEQQGYFVTDDIELAIHTAGNEVDESSLAAWLAGKPNPNASMFANIKQVPQGAFVMITQQQTPTTHYYWDIDAKNSRFVGSFEQYVPALQDLLLNKVSDTIVHNNRNNGPVFCQLSGGMDSTSVTALAHIYAQQRQITLHTISHTYTTNASCNEIDNIRAMTNHFNFADSHYIELDKYTSFSFAESYPTHLQSPGIVLSPKYHEEAQLLNNHQSSMLLTGNGGDEMFWGHSLSFFDRFTDGQLSVIVEVIQSAKKLQYPVTQALRSVFLSPMKQSLLSALKGTKQAEQLTHTILPKWLTNKTLDLIERVERKPNPFLDEKHSLGRYARYEGLFNSTTFNSMRSYQAVFKQYGLTVHHPLFDKDIAEFSFAAPQHLHLSGEYPKLLLRQTMTTHLPEQVCWNKSKTVFDEHFAMLIKQDRENIRSLLCHEGLADMGLLDNDIVLAEFDSLMAQANPKLHVDLLYLILVQSWYQAHITH